MPDSTTAPAGPVEKQQPASDEPETRYVFSHASIHFTQPPLTQVGQHQPVERHLVAGEQASDAAAGAELVERAR